MKKLLGILIVCAILLIGITTRNSEDSIIVYSCLEQFRNEELQKQLNEEFPDLDVYVMYVSTAKAAAKLSVEGEKTDADMIVALDNAYMSKVEEYMADVSEFSHLDYLEDMIVPSGRYLTWERQAGSIIVNKTILKKYNLPMPETYEDLLDPVYKNMIAMPDPKSSGTGFFFFKNLVNVMGEQEAFDYIDKLAVNIKQFTESGSGPVKLLLQGEIAIGFGLTFQGVDELNNGNDFVIIEPEFGSPYSLDSIALLKGRETNPDIVRIFEYIANDYMLYDKAYVSPEQVLKVQENNIPNYPKNIKYADMTGISDMKEKERLLSLWKY